MMIAKPTVVKPIISETRATVNDAAEEVAHVAVNAQEVLWPVGRAAEQVDARPGAHFDRLDANEDPVRLVGRDDRRSNGDQH